MATLYRRILGDAFDTLPEALRALHDRERGGCARGVLCVTRGRGRAVAVLAALLRLPPAGENVPLRLSVEVDDARERWTRDFGGRCLETVQWARDGLLIEAVGPLHLGLRLTSCRESLRFELARGWLWGLPLPPALAPRIEGMAAASRQDAWSLHVRVEAPLLGLLLQYEGEVELT
jgi:hypothetical protein